jgi:hypothetical protein
MHSENTRNAKSSPNTAAIGPSYLGLKLMSNRKATISPWQAESGITFSLISGRIPVFWDSRPRCWLFFVAVKCCISAGMGGWLLDERLLKGHTITLPGEAAYLSLQLVSLTHSR